MSVVLTIRRVLLGACAGVGVLLAAPAVAATGAPAVTTGGSSGVTATSATLTGTINPEGQATTYIFEYGTTTAYGSTTPSPPASAGSGTKDVPASQSAASLAPSTTYHYRLVATNATGSTNGADRTFTTKPAPPGPAPPAVTTGGTKAVTATSATLLGTVNPKGQATTYFFEYGTSTTYGTTIPSPPGNAGSGTRTVSVSAGAVSLAPSTTYHYRLVATNATGATTGADRVFTTTKSAVVGVTIGASPNPTVYGQPTTFTGTVSGPGAGHATVALERSGSATGPFVNVATTTTHTRGNYSFAGVVPASNAFYRAVFGGVTSKLVLVGVRFAVTLGVTNTRPRRGKLDRFLGRVTPVHDGARVQIQRLGADGRWHTIATALLHTAVPGVSGYNIRLRVRQGGLYRAMVKPDSYHARGFSGVIRIALRR